MFIERDLQKNIKTFLKTKEKHSNCLLLSGARQVGKSSLVKNTLKNHPHLFLNLYESPNLVAKMDQTESFQEFEDLLFLETGFAPSKGKILVIDEAQESKKLGRWIRFFKEKWPHQKVVVLGSILSQLFSENKNYPVGRVTEFTLYSFHFEEFLRAANQNHLVEWLNQVPVNQQTKSVYFDNFWQHYLQYLQVGGMPDVVLRSFAKENRPESLWEQLINQYALDIERYLGDNYKTLFLSAIKRIADLTCQPSKYSQIISSDSPAYRKTPKLLEVLEKWKLITLLSAKTKQPEAGLGMAAKRYLFDVGLTSFCLNRNQALQLKKRSDLENPIFGKLQENFVIHELLSLSPSAVLRLHYYKENKNSKEVDVLFSIQNSTLPIEVKSQTQINRNSLIPMINYLDRSQQNLGILIYNNNPQILSHKQKTILAIPPFLVRQIPRLVEELKSKNNIQ